MGPPIAATPAVAAAVPPTPECNNSIPLLPVHEAVLNDLLKKWSNQFNTISTSSRKQLKQWSTKLKKTKDSIKQQRELTLLNEKMLASDITNSTLLSETFLTAKQHIEEEIIYITETMEEIDLLLNSDYLIVILKEMLNHSFNDFSDTELRVFFLLFFDKIQINFEKNNEIQISYRLSPFVSLENSTG